MINIVLFFSTVDILKCHSMKRKGINTVLVFREHFWRFVMVSRKAEREDVGHLPDAGRTFTNGCWPVSKQEYITQPVF